MLRTDAGAFVEGPRLIEAGAPGGPLSGLTFTAKELYDVRGLPTGCGNPTLRAAAEPATANAAAVQRLLDAGADLTGTTVTVEFAWALSGINPHDGTPDNPADPYGLPGGSSAGASAATAAGFCDLALGSDTAGSVRIPATYCGVLGIRPTFGRVPLTGVAPLCPSFDTAGWFARDPGVFAEAGKVLLDDWSAPGSPDGITILTDAFAVASAEVRNGLEPLVAAAIDRVSGAVIETDAGSPGFLGELAVAFGARGSREGWESNRAYFERFGLDGVGEEIRPRFETAPLVTDDQVAMADEIIARAKQRVDVLTEGGHAIAILPAAPMRAPRRHNAIASAAPHRRPILELTGLSSLTGAPSVTVPYRTMAGTQVGLSLLGAPGTDEMLIDFAVRLIELLSL
jgi:amidase